MFMRSRRVGKKKAYKDPTFSQIFNTSLDSQTGETEVLQNPTQIVEIIIYQLSNMRFPEEKKISSTKSIRLLGRQNHLFQKKLSFLGSLVSSIGQECPAFAIGKVPPAQNQKKKEGDLSKTKICVTPFFNEWYFSLFTKNFFLKIQFKSAQTCGYNDNSTSSNLQLL